MLELGFILDYFRNFDGTLQKLEHGKEQLQFNDRSIIQFEDGKIEKIYWQSVFSFLIKLVQY